MNNRERKKEKKIQGGGNMNLKIHKKKYIYSTNICMYVCENICVCVCMCYRKREREYLTNICWNLLNVFYVNMLS